MSPTNTTVSPFTYTTERPPDSKAQLEFTEDGYVKISSFADRYTLRTSARMPTPRPCSGGTTLICQCTGRIALSQLEYVRGVAATYFIRLQSEYYNAFEWPIRRMIQEISTRGHASGSILRLIPA